MREYVRVRYPVFIVSKNLHNFLNNIILTDYIIRYII